MVGNNLTYLLQLKANVAGAVRKFQTAMQQTARSTKQVTTGMGKLESNMGKVFGRAMLTIPAWFALRRVFMALFSVISQMVTGLADLEDGMARIQTVTHGTTEEISNGMAIMEEAIINMSLKSGKSFKELAETMYFLKTANLEMNEAMAAFEPTVNAMIATGVDGRTMARIVAGTYNTVGKELLKNMTASEAMAHINDVLTYTYATQDVQMNELAESYTKIAPYLTGLSDSYIDIVTVLGVLNTHMLRAGRTGRLTGRSILQLTKNADKLANIFDITFDPNKPINFLDTLTQVFDKIKSSGDITAAQQQAIQEVFATRGGVPIRILMEAWDDVTSSIKLARENARGFAEAMAEIRLGTVRAQAQRVQTALNTLFRDFITGTTNAGSFADALKEIADNLGDMREEALAAGLFIRSLIELWAELSQKAGTLSFDITQPKTKKELLMEIIKGGPFGAGKFLKNYFFSGEEGVSYSKIKARLEKKQLQNQEKSLAYEKKLNVYREQITDNEERLKELQEISLNRRKSFEETLRHEVSLMKILGATELEIAQYRLQSWENIKFTLDPLEKELMFQKLINQEVEEQVRTQQELQNTLGSLAFRYEEASPMERGRIRQAMELRRLEPEKLASIYQSGGRDRGIIRQYISSFSDQQQKAVENIIMQMRGLTTNQIQMAETEKAAWWTKVHKMGGLAAYYRQQKEVGVTAQPTTAEKATLITAPEGGLSVRDDNVAKAIGEVKSEIEDLNKRMTSLQKRGNDILDDRL